MSNPFRSMEEQPSKEENLHHLKDLSELRYLVIDEADRMLRKGQYEELNNILEVMRRSKYDSRKEMKRSIFTDSSLAIQQSEQLFDKVIFPKELPQTFIFSATMTVHSDIKLYFKRHGSKKVTRQKNPILDSAGCLTALLRRLNFRRNPIIIDVNHSRMGVHEQINEYGSIDNVIKCDSKDSVPQLRKEASVEPISRVSGLATNVVETMAQVPEADRDALLYKILW